MSQSKPTVEPYSLLLLDLETTHTGFVGLNIIYFFSLFLKHTSNIHCRPMALGARKTDVVRIHVHNMSQAGEHINIYSKEFGR